MRKIEQEMVSALNGRRNWRKGNTEVLQDRNCGGMSVYLHHNLIAFTHGSEVLPVLRTFLNYPTRTTVSRLRALGIDAAIRKGQPYINEIKV